MDCFLVQQKNLITEQAKQTLRNDKISSAASQQVLKDMDREIWLIDGSLQHRFSVESLQLVVEKFKRIKAVPSGYRYPELLACEEVPEYMKRIRAKKRISKQ